MRSAVSKFALSLVLVVAGVTAALSADVGEAIGADQSRPGSIRDFIRANPGCLEFNDQCSFCVVVDGVAECATPQIACVKQKSECTKQASR